MSHKLSIIPTPIGNLGDITIRALDTLRAVDAVLCEDTRQSSKLMSHYEISKPLIAFHKMNEYKEVDKIIQQILSGKWFALISDAGTPVISDPGNIIITKCIEKNIAIDCLPGATAFVPALVNSGFDLSEFLFMGFPPHKKGRQTFIKKIIAQTQTVVIYESPYRILKFLHEMTEFGGEHKMISISREISKKFEETLRGTSTELANHFENHEPIGEFVVVISK